MLEVWNTEATIKTTMLDKISPYYLTFPIQPIMGGYAWPTNMEGWWGWRQIRICRKKIPVKLQSAFFYLVGEQNLTRNDLKLQWRWMKMMIKWSQWRTIKWSWWNVQNITIIAALQTWARLCKDDSEAFDCEQMRSHWNMVESIILSLGATWQREKKVNGREKSDRQWHFSLTWSLLRC